MKTLLPAKTQHELYQYLQACSNLYGIISLKNILKIYNQQNKPVSEEHFLRYIDSLDYDNEFFSVFGADEMYEDYPPVAPVERDLVAEYLYDIDYDEYYTLREKQAGIPYYVPAKKQLLKYADQFYIEKTPEFISLRSFLRNLDNVSRETADSIAEDLELTAQMENNSVMEMINLVNMRGIEFSNIFIAEEFQELCYELDINTRKHIFCGHTNVELYNL